jgi:hypothetical protein
MNSLDEPIRPGVRAADLSDMDLQNELGSVHQSRNATLRHGSDAALAQHDARMAELEAEYLARYPEREVDVARTRAGARDGVHGTAADNLTVRTGSDQPWDPEDVAEAQGLDPTPANVERARRILADEGAAAIERIVP